MSSPLLSGLTSIVFLHNPLPDPHYDIHSISIAHARKKKGSVAAQQGWSTPQRDLSLGRTPSRLTDD